MLLVNRTRIYPLRNFECQYYAKVKVQKWIRNFSKDRVPSQTGFHAETSLVAS